MTPFLRNRWRAAEAIAAQLSQSVREISQLVFPTPVWDRLVALQRTLNKVHQRKWHHATATTLDAIRGQIGEVSDALATLQTQVEQCAARAKPFLPGDIFRDLLQLDDEFSEVTCDLASEEIAVVTDAVELDDVALGRFRVCLQWGRLNRGASYRVEALDPNPASSNTDVTHPHVSSERLCEGDGRAAIALALAEGRLLDFFVMVDRLLSTYASGRAYVELNHWHGVPCHDCGTTLSPDDHLTCTHCEEPICDDCYQTCEQCGDAYCSNCCETCRECQQTTCRHCLGECARCKVEYCDSCLDEARHCPTCVSELEDEAEAETDAAETPLHSDGLDQAQVSA